MVQCEFCLTEISNINNLSRHQKTNKCLKKQDEMKNKKN